MCLMTSFPKGVATDGWEERDAQTHEQLTRSRLTFLLRETRWVKHVEETQEVGE